MRYCAEELSVLRAKIMQEVAYSGYDHRKYMPQRVKDMYPHMLENCQLQYSRFKLAVVKVLQPKCILELGTGWGVSAKAMMEGCRTAKFLGIDNAADGIHPSEVLPMNDRVGFILDDTDNIPDFTFAGNPDFETFKPDFIHVDGNHGREHKCRDIIKAFEARPQWILVDDMNDVMVAAGTYDGIYKVALNPLRCLLFENSHTGNLLIHAGGEEIERR